MVKINNKNNLLEYIDENKYNELDKQKLFEYTDKDLLCILFTRFKNSNNILMIEMLNIYKILINSDNNNNKLDKNKTNSNIKKYIKNKNINSNLNIFTKRAKSKYNNKQKKD